MGKKRNVKLSKINKKKNVKKQQKQGKQVQSQGIKNLVLRNLERINNRKYKDINQNLDNQIQKRILNTRKKHITKLSKMKYVAAYALLALNGSQPSEADVKALIESVNGTVDATKLSSFMNVIKGKNIEDVIKAGLSKVGNIGGAAPAAAPAAATKAPEAKKEEPKKEEPKKEEDDFEGAGDLFDF
ncbi:60S acidic ribosomal protein (macronuclear) [Tetrahymena thermophila SB210]|uniref:60S acidic ribosomal protein n=1 Tax=Tetrahymena thermophila (strain SB210) TaxID=312017 RepID=I7MA52_TETTS|nr:60S acidic ribosomal protein [Tetrahymena thermophila SB210]EAS03734.4 60S acidic ribosomal protein [Tetrahymena thermophila SB210]|eukprot:XP_001023979.4 60S acidic ribosomal protein [Tetrahymena thermophila SB210]